MLSCGGCLLGEGRGAGLVEHACQKQCARQAPPHPCRGSRWPGLPGGGGETPRGRGIGEEIEKSNGGGQLGVCGWPSGCLMSKCAGGTNELCSFMVSCLQDRGARLALRWRNQGWEPTWGAAWLLGQGLPGWAGGGVFVLGLSCPFPLFKGEARPCQALTAWRRACL